MSGAGHGGHQAGEAVRRRVDQPPQSAAVQQQSLDVALRQRAFGKRTDLKTIVVAGQCQYPRTDGNRLGSGKRYDPTVIAAFMSVLGGDATEVSAEQARETAVSTHKLEAGMVLSRDLIGPGGMLMLSADHTLDTRMIEKLTSYARAGRLHETVHVWMERKG